MFKVSSDKRTPALVNKLTLGIVGLVTVIASKLTDLGLVASVGGATFGTALVFVYPAIMLRRMLYQRGEKGSLEGKVASLVAVLGVVMGAIGTNMALRGVDV
jgi:hypothetical protein